MTASGYPAFRRTKPLLWLVVIALAMLPTATAAAQGDWTAVLRLGQGRIVRVETTSTRTLRGRLVAVTPDTLDVDADGDVQRIARSEIIDVYAAPGLKRSAVKGLLIGAAAGVSIGLVTAESNRGSWAVMLGAGWAAIGTVIGSLTGIADGEHLIYSSTSNAVP